MGEAIAVPVKVPGMTFDEFNLEWGERSRSSYSREHFLARKAYAMLSGPIAPARDATAVIYLMHPGDMSGFEKWLKQSSLGQQARAGQKWLEVGGSLGANRFTDDQWTMGRYPWVTDLERWKEGRKLSEATESCLARARRVLAKSRHRTREK